MAFTILAVALLTTLVLLLFVIVEAVTGLTISTEVIVVHTGRHDILQRIRVGV